VDKTLRLVQICKRSDRLYLIIFLCVRFWGSSINTAESERNVRAFQNLRSAWVERVQSSSFTFLGMEIECDTLASAVMNGLKQELTAQVPTFTRDSIVENDGAFVIVISSIYVPLQNFRNFMKELESNSPVVFKNSKTLEVLGVAVPLSQIDNIIERHGGSNVLLSQLPYEVFLLDLAQSSELRAKDPQWMFKDEDVLSKFSGGEFPDHVIQLDPDQVQQAHFMLPMNYLELSATPIGVFLRQISRPELNKKPQKIEARGTSRLTPLDIDVVGVTTHRRKSVQELLKSIRTFLGTEIAITVVVQSKSTFRWKRLSRRYGAKFIHVPEDTGLSASRNIGVRAGSKKLVFLMDDDFQIDDRCRLMSALTVLDENPGISILGGNLLDVDDWGDPEEDEKSQGFAMKLLSGPPDLLWVRLEDMPRTRTFIAPDIYFEQCDIVDNFALIRRDAVFGRGVFWEDEIKINSEHQEFYLRMNLAGEGTVARTNALKVRNVRVQDKKFRKMRFRQDFFFTYFDKWHLHSFEILGERSRVRAQDGHHFYMERGSRTPNKVRRLNH
jgi:glycosyltransferase involved in cell wall biosynthesis